MIFLFFQLDGPHAGQNYDKDEDEEEDFYEAANAMPMRENNVTVALHRSEFSHKMACFENFNTIFGFFYFLQPI